MEEKTEHHALHLLSEVELGVEFPDPDEMRLAAEFLLEELRLERSDDSPYELSIHIVDDPAIQEINREYRDKDKPTDVLSFPLLDIDVDPENAFPNPGEHVNIGDLIISADTCAEQAINIGHSVSDEFYRLMTHGLLHLFGYDHELSEAEDKRQRTREDALLEQLAQKGI